MALGAHIVEERQKQMGEGTEEAQAPTMPEVQKHFLEQQYFRAQGLVSLRHSFSIMHFVGDAFR